MKKTSSTRHKSRRQLSLWGCGRTTTTTTTTTTDTRRRTNSLPIGTISLPLLLLVLLTGTLVPSSCSAKKVVMFAGPHKAASQSVESFFYHHASGYEGTTVAEGLKGWLWPKVTDDLWDIDQKHSLDKSSIFNALVTQTQNATAQIILNRAIQEAWEASEHGIIIGTPEFDRIGHTPFTHRNGLEAMRGILNQLRIEDVDDDGTSASTTHDDVTVVLNYRAPRRDQWISIWKHVEADVHYKQFLCHGDQDELVEILDTAMNPLKLAHLFRKERWKVVLMDMSGIDALNKDISHAIACDVLDHTHCEDGFVIPVMQTTYNENYGGNKTFDSLDDRRQRDMDQLFRERDCYYETFLQNDAGFQVLYRDTLWQGCLRPDESVEEEKTQKAIYAHLADAQTMLEALRDQKGCGKKKGTKIKNVLVSNNYTSMTVSTISGSGVIFDDTDGDGYPMEDFLAPEEPLLTRHKTKKDEDSPWLTAFLVLVAGGFGMYQLHLIRRQGNRGYHGQFFSSPGGDAGDQEMVDFSQIKVKHHHRPMELSLDLDLPESDDFEGEDFSHIDQSLSKTTILSPGRSSGSSSARRSKNGAGGSMLL